MAVKRMPIRWFGRVGARRRARGFTLIELMAAMGILTILVLLMARVFTETSAMWQSSERQIMGASEGRVIMDFLVREFSLAIADDVVAFKHNSDADALRSIPAYGAESDEIAFVAMTRPGTAQGDFRRTSNQFYYWVTNMRDENDNIIPNRYRLVRTRLTRAMFSNPGQRARSAYTYPPSTDGLPFAWWTEMPGGDEGTLQFLETIAENIAAFEIWAYGLDGSGNIVSIFSYDSRIDNHGGNNLNRLPLYVDIYLEMLGETEAIQAAALWSSNQDAARQFVDRQAQRFTARVQFPNRDRAMAF